MKMSRKRAALNRESKHDKEYYSGAVISEQA
jgi:hypothetical protein